MHEQIHWAAGARLPLVMCVVNRAVGAPWCIWNDHQDSISQRDTWNYDLDLSLALSVHGQVLQVARVVPLRVLPAVLLAFGIEVAAGRLEIGAFAFGRLMKVNGMLAGR